ncbi:MAG: HNH endonuclease [Anaerolineae bacterium]|nr:HNH endonuclease [Anaerolineae bacterium]
MTAILGGQRRRIAERAAYQCEYCHLPERCAGALHEVHYIIPARHGGGNVPENLCYACLSCILHKGTDIASIDPLRPDDMIVVPLFHPRQQAWAQHFRLVDGRIEGLTPVGRVTVRQLDLNDLQRVEIRRRLHRLKRQP